MAIQVVRNDITKMNIEAIVNTANRHATYGPGVDSAVYKAAGEELLLGARREIGEVEPGEVFITPGFNLPAKYIIHAVSPAYIDGDSGEEEKLRSCYSKALALAQKSGITSIAFPLISTGSFGYPKADGLRIAVDECNTFLLKNDMDIKIVVFDSNATMMAEKIFPGLDAYIDHNYVCNKREEEYGDAYYDSISPTDSQHDKYMERVSRLERRIGSANAANPVGQSGPFGTQPLMAAPAASATDGKKGTLKHKDFSLPFLRGNKKSKSEKDKCEVESGLFANQSVAGPFKTLETSYYEDFGDYSDALGERLEHMADPFGKYVMYLIEKKGKTNIQVQNEGWIDRKRFSKMKTNQETYRPEKRTACQLCVGLGLNHDECKDLLIRAGLSLSPSILEDVIWEFFFEMDPEEYDIFDVSDALEEHGLKPIVVLEEKKDQCV